jgi:hypothetical protein
MYDKVGDFKKEDPEAKKQRKAAAAAAVTAAAANERREVEKLREQMLDLIAQQVQQKIREIIPMSYGRGLLLGMRQVDEGR